MESLKLYEFIQGAEDDSKILAELERHIGKGEELSWFQDIIPGLIPGVDENQPWLDQARKLLWTDEQYEEHKKKIDRKMKLAQPDPIPLALDRYRLGKHWPVYVEALRPMSRRMLAAANEIYRVVARQDCLTEERNTVGLTGETDNKHNAFVTVAVVLQDKVLSPIICDIEQRQESLDGEIRRAQDRLSALAEKHGHFEVEDDEETVDEGYERTVEEDNEDYEEDEDVEDAEDAVDEDDEQAMQGRLDRLIEENQESRMLLEGLTKFRDVLVEEKEMRDLRKNLKRSSGVEPSDLDTAVSGRSAKRRLPLR